MIRHAVGHFLVALAFAAAAFAALVAGDADGHYKKRGEVNDTYGDWYFRGQTFKEREARRDHWKDPVNFIFYGADADQTEYTRSRVETHMNDDWSTRAVGGRPWRKDSEIRFFCKDDQYMVWRHLPGRDADRTDFHGTTARFPGVCGNQHHARFWDDYEHWKGTAHGRRDQWIVGAIHHEKVVTKFCCLGHKPDRDWDRVRAELTKAMSRHCSHRRWKYHPGADHPFQEKTNFGFVARLTLQHRASGCSGQ